MYRLICVSGPAKGEIFKLQDGETSIGRVEGNGIVLVSARVSKRHCVLQVRGSEVMLRDEGSANGTFVNGVLVRSRKLVQGDQVSVGDFVLELREHSATRVSTVRPSPALLQGLGGDFGNQFPAAAAPYTGGIAPGAFAPGTAAGISGGDAGGAAGKGAAMSLDAGDLKAKIKQVFEQYVVNFVYNLNEVYEWRTLMFFMFAALVVIGSFVSVYPVLERTHEKLSLEARGRALLLARQMVDRNSALLAEGNDTKMDISFIEREQGVTAAYIVDMDGRILAPGRKLNQYITQSDEAAFSALARQSFNEKENQEQGVKTYGGIVAVAIPVRVLSTQVGKNVTRALGLVFFDQTIVRFDFATEVLAYIQALMLASLVGYIAYLVLYRLTIRPLTALNDGIDQVLKGGSGLVNIKFKMAEIAPLVDVVNAALQRALAASGAVPAAGPPGDNFSVEEMASALKALSVQGTSGGVLMLSATRKVLHLNPFMEEITGIHSDGAVGQAIDVVARDAAFVSFVDDILGKVSSGMGGPVTDEFEFSGVNYRMECSALGGLGSLKAYVLTAQRV